MIEVERLSQAFRAPSGEAFLALEDVSFTVAQGEFVSIIGPSGSGKSTLLRVLADSLSATSGEVKVGGKSPRQARLDRDFSLVFQQPVLFDWRQVVHNVELPLEIAGQPRAERGQRAKSLLERVGLEQFASYRPWQLSGGMQQRAAIARALASGPSILLLDEPFGALDELTRDAMNAELLNLCEGAGVTAVLVTHSIQEAVLLSDHVLVLGPSPGRIVATIAVNLPRPRAVAVRDTDEFFHLVTAVRQHLRRSISV